MKIVNFSMIVPRSYTERHRYVVVGIETCTSFLGIEFNKKVTYEVITRRRQGYWINEITRKTFSHEIESEFDILFSEECRTENKERGRLLKERTRRNK